MGNVSLKVLEKFVNFLFKKGTNPVRVYFYFYVNSDLIQIRADSFPAKMFRAAIG